MKVNLHLLELCNFKCKHCFAKFGSKQLVRFDDWKVIINNVLSSGFIDAINLAGGEPLMHPDFIDIVKYINSLNVKIGIITNGSLLSSDFVRNYSFYFDEIGISVDSFDPVVNIDIGRCTHDLVSLRFMDVEDKINLIRENSDAKIKVNTVVSSSNKSDVIVAEMNYLNINRWKIFRMQDFENGSFSNKSQGVTDDEFNYYAGSALAYFHKIYKKERILLLK